MVASESSTNVKPNCTAGTSCGNSCISRKDGCLATLEGSAAKVAQALVAQITGEAQRSKGAGVGSASMTEVEISQLIANEEFLRNATPAEIVARAKQRGLQELSEDGGGAWSETELSRCTDAVWQALPAKTRTHLKNKGSLATGNYYNPDTGEHGSPNEPRAKALLRRFIEQNGRDVYTGQPITLTGSDLEHIEPFGKLGKVAERSDNWVFTSSSVNQRKAEKSFDEFYSEQVSPIAKAASQDPEYWSKQDAKATQANAKKNAVDDMLAEKAKDSWTSDDVDSLGSKYYYAGRALGHLLSYEKTRPRGVSGQTFNMRMGPPLAKAFAEAYRSGDASRIQQLESARVAIVSAAKAESKESKGNAGAKGGGMEAEYERQKAALGWA